MADELSSSGARAGFRQPHELSVAPGCSRELGPVRRGARGARRRSGPLARGTRRPGNRRGDLLGAAESFERIGSVPDEAYARLRAAEALVAVGNRAEADRQLRLALSVFGRLGATAWAAEAESLLAESA